MNNSTKKVIAVDLGGTKAALGLVSSQGEILSRLSEPTCQDGGDLGVQQISRLCKKILEAHHLQPADITAIGIGLPAVLEHESDYVIWGPNLNGWKEIHAAQIIQQSLKVPVFLEYDGHTAALGEWWRGAGKGFGSMVSVIIGTGVGGGMILDGHLVRGQNRLAGAVGWFVMTTDRSLSFPESHKLGHWESLVAGPGIEKRAKQAIAAYPDSKLNTLSTFSAKDVFDYAQNDAFAAMIVEETAYLIGLGLANIVSILNPQVIVLGGSIGQFQGEGMRQTIEETILQWAQPYSARHVRIIPSQLGADAGMLGAAYQAFLRAGVSINEQP